LNKLIEPGKTIEQNPKEKMSQCVFFTAEILMLKEAGEEKKNVIRNGSHPLMCFLRRRFVHAG